MNLLDLLDQFRAIAQNGLNYAKDPYDRQRYEKMMDVVSYEYSALSGLSSEEIKARFAKELGYITPKVGVQCTLFNDRNEVLLEKRADDKLWGLPSGWVDPGETPEASIIRELKEEANLELHSVRFIGLYTRIPGIYQQPHTSVHILYLCDKWSGTVSKSFESLEMKFCNPYEITEWHKDHRQQALDALVVRSR